MRSVIAIAALAGLGAAQNLDVAAIQAAPPPAKTMAPVDAVSDSVAHSAASASAIGAGAVHHNERSSMRKRQTRSSTVSSGTQTTMNTVTSSSTSSSTSACPTTPEAGTYCGFINPEDPCAKQPDGMYLFLFYYLHETWMLIQLRLWASHHESGYCSCLPELPAIPHPSSTSNRPGRGLCEDLFGSQRGCLAKFLPWVVHP